ncbi:hypothetical protein Acr_07g0013230 [Actinidia rufa]|uniref:Uncharacterized protein n=1 Tax=Actinidia rufa TaxID=165716 RepID=A0A7J0EZS0_9ERIC|nr:hypothetical protein Acr_07g0013230 [Actinidia rufa]
MPSWAGSLNFEEIRSLNTLCVNGGSVCLIKVSIITGAFVPVLMASSRASKSQFFLRCGLVSCLDMIASVRAPPPSRPKRPPERLEWRDRSISGTGGAAGSGGLAAVRSCIRRPLFLFMVLICSAMLCISRWRPSRSGTCPELAIGRALLSGGLLALGLGSLLDTGPRILEGRPAQTNKNKRPGRGCSKPLRRGDQTKVMTADRILVGLDRAKYSTSPKGEEETALWLWASSMEIAWRGSMLNGGLVLPRSRGFGDKQPSERSRTTKYVMVLGRPNCLGSNESSSSTTGFCLFYAGRVRKIQWLLALMWKPSTGLLADTISDLRRVRGQVQPKHLMLQLGDYGAIDPQKQIQILDRNTDKLPVIDTILKIRSSSGQTKSVLSMAMYLV